MIIFSGMPYTNSGDVENLFVKGIILTPLARNVDGTWIQVQVQDADHVGWIPVSSKFVKCGNLRIGTLPTIVSSSSIACSPIPTTSPAITATVTNLQPDSKIYNLRIQSPNSLWMPRYTLSITDNEGNTYEPDCAKMMGQCYYYQTILENNQPFQLIVDGILKHPIDTNAAQVTLSLRIHRAETGPDFLLTWQQTIP